MGNQAFSGTAALALNANAARNSQGKFSSKAFAVAVVLLLAFALLLFPRFAFAQTSESQPAADGQNNQSPQVETRLQQASSAVAASNAVVETVAPAQSIQTGTTVESAAPTATATQTTSATTISTAADAAPAALAQQTQPGDSALKAPQAAVAEKPADASAASANATGTTAAHGASAANADAPEAANGITAQQKQPAQTEDVATSATKETNAAKAAVANTISDSATSASTDLAVANDAALYAQAAGSYANVGIAYNTHVQNIGWQDYVSNGKMAGTSGRALRLEGIHIKLTGTSGLNGSVKYQTHVQNIGWQDAVANDEMSGTTGLSYRLEGIKIWLTGTVSSHYDIFYRTHVQNVGWQGWVKNGEMAGTSGRALRLEGIEIKLSPKTEEAAGKGANAVGIRYEGHVQNDGWQMWTGDGGTAGTSGRSLRVEALNIVLSTGPYSGNIDVQAHVQNIGWQKAVHSGGMAGTSGKGLRVEAFKMNLTGEIANHYDVYYRTHVQNYGWLDWAKNGTLSGSTGYALRIEAVEVQLVKKGAKAPSPTAEPSVDSKRKTLNGIDIASWQAGINIAGVNADFVIVKATQGNWYTNPYFYEHANATLASGKLLGTYHFADLRGSATAQADYFVNTVGPYLGQTALFLDWEADALSLGPGWAQSFMDRVYSRTGVKPLIYTSQSVTNEYNWSSVSQKYDLWLARYLYRNMHTGYLDNPDGATGYGYWNNVKLYQYSSTGRISGYGSDLDLDKFYGTGADWKRLCAKS